MWIGNKPETAYEKFKKLSLSIGEGPGLNIRGRLSDSILYFSFDKSDKQIKTKNVSFVKSTQGNALLFRKQNSYAELSIPEVGYN